jgi:hypothetical protein
MGNLTVDISFILSNYLTKNVTETLKQLQLFWPEDESHCFQIPCRSPANGKVNKNFQYFPITET